MSGALLLDTSSLFFRAHHALPPMNTSTGEPTAALYGFCSLLIKLLREVRPDGVAFARDLPQPTFRHREYDAYKAGRAPLPDALRSQFPRLDALIAAFGAPSHAALGFEADDVLATLARRLAESGGHVTIVSGDRDLFQVIGPRVAVLFVGARGQKAETVDAAVVGVRTASKLVTKFGTAENLVANLDSVTPPKVRDALAAAADRIRLNERLARLRDDLDLGAGPLVAPFDAAHAARVRELFEALEFKSLIGRLDALVRTEPGTT